MAHPFTSGFLLIDGLWHIFNNLTALNEFIDRKMSGYPVDTFRGKPFCTQSTKRPALIDQHDNGQYVLIGDFPWQQFLYEIKQHGDYTLAQQTLFQQFYSADNVTKC